VKKPSWDEGRMQEALVGRNSIKEERENNHENFKKSHFLLGNKVEGKG